jgi:hypothetical protein
MSEALLTQGEAAKLVGRTRMCVNQWHVDGRAGVGSLARYHIDEIEADPAKYGVTAEDVERFKLTHYHTQRFVILKLDLLRYNARVSGPGYPAGRPRRKKKT